MKYFKTLLLFFALTLVSNSLFAQYYGGQQQRQRSRQSAIPSTPEKAPEPLTVKESVDAFLVKNAEGLQLDEFQKAILRVNLIELTETRQKIIADDSPREQKIAQFEIEQEKFNSTIAQHLNEEQVSFLKSLMTTSKEKKKKKKKRKKEKPD